MREKHYFNQDRNFWINVQQNDVLAVKLKRRIWH